MGIYVSNKLYRRGRSEQPKADKKKANSPTYNYASKHNEARNIPQNYTQLKNNSKCFIQHN